MPRFTRYTGEIVFAANCSTFAMGRVSCLEVGSEMASFGTQQFL